MKVAVISLVRNEADIFPVFAQHLSALFDTALFLDHGSTDGTGAMIEAACRERAGWRHWLVRVPGLHQSLFTTFALRNVFATTDVSAAVLLDADEFIDVADRGALHAALASALPGRCVPCFAWRNAMPCVLDGAPLCIDDTLLVAPGVSAFRKAIVTRALFEATGGALRPLAGNHVIDPGDGIALSEQLIGRLLHVPLRSVEQMTRKTLLAALAHLGRRDRRPHEGVHRFAALSRIAEGAWTDDDLRGWAARYGEDGAHASPLSERALQDAGFTRRKLDVAHAAITAVPPPQTQGLAAGLAASLREWNTENGEGMQLALHGDILQAKSPASPPDGAEMLRAERDAARAEIAALRGSTSWRVTAPLRALFRKAGGAVPTPPDPPSCI